MFPRTGALATPVILARNLGRLEEQVDVLPLSDVTTAMADMLTLVMVGSSKTRVIDGDNSRRQVYTPRGYGDKNHDGSFHRRGTGAADLITVQGLKLIQSCPLCLYAGSLVPAEVVTEAPEARR